MVPAGLAGQMGKEVDEYIWARSFYAYLELGHSLL